MIDPSHALSRFRPLPGRMTRPTAPHAGFPGGRGHSLYIDSINGYCENCDYGDAGSGDTLVRTICMKFALAPRPAASGGVNG